MANEVVEAVEVIEAAKVLRPGKSLLMTAEPFRFLNSALFRCFKKNCYNHETYILAPFKLETVEASLCYCKTVREVIRWRTAVHGDDGRNDETSATI